MNIPTIFLLNNINEPSVLRKSNNKPFAVVVKPFSQTDLKNAINVTLHQHERDTKLKEIEVGYGSMLENLQDAYFQINREGKIILTSPSSASLF